MNTQTDAATHPDLPPNLADLSPYEALVLARTFFPKQGANMQIFHRLVVNWQKCAYADNYETRWLIKTAPEFLSDLPYNRATIYRALKQFAAMHLIVKIQAPHLYDKSPSKRHCNWIAMRVDGPGGYHYRALPRGH